MSDSGPTFLCGEAREFTELAFPVARPGSTFSISLPTLR